MKPFPQWIAATCSLIARVASGAVGCHAPGFQPLRARHLAAPSDEALRVIFASSVAARRPALR